MAVVAALAVGLLFLLSGGLVLAQETIEYAEKGKGPVATFTAEDPEGASIQWSLGGVDAGDFTIENGVLRFKASPDFENPKGAARRALPTPTPWRCRPPTRR